jgi:hypothetical protein
MGLWLISDESLSMLLHSRIFKRHCRSHTQRQLRAQCSPHKQWCHKYSQEAVQNHTGQPQVHTTFPLNEENSINSLPNRAGQSLRLKAPTTPRPIPMSRHSVDPQSNQQNLHRTNPRAVGAPTWIDCWRPGMTTGNWWQLNDVIRIMLSCNWLGRMSVTRHR